MKSPKSKSTKDATLLAHSLSGLGSKDYNRIESDVAEGSDDGASTQQTPDYQNYKVGDMDKKSGDQAQGDDDPNNKNIKNNDNDNNHSSQDSSDSPDTTDVKENDAENRITVGSTPNGKTFPAVSGADQETGVVIYDEQDGGVDTKQDTAEPDTKVTTKIENQTQVDKEEMTERMDSNYAFDPFMQRQQSVSNENGQNDTGTDGAKGCVGSCKRCSFAVLVWTWKFILIILGLLFGILGLLFEYVPESDGDKIHVFDVYGYTWCYWWCVTLILIPTCRWLTRSIPNKLLTYLKQTNYHSLHWQVTFYILPCVNPFRRVLIVTNSFLCWLLLMNVFDSDRFDVWNELLVGDTDDVSTYLVKIFEVFLAVIITVYMLLIKTVLVRWILSKMYLKTYFKKVTKLLKTEETFKKLLNAKAKTKKEEEREKNRHSSSNSMRIRLDGLYTGQKPLPDLFRPNLLNFLVAYPSLDHPENYFQDHGHFRHFCLIARDYGVTTQDRLAGDNDDDDGDHKVGSESDITLTNLSKMFNLHNYKQTGSNSSTGGSAARMSAVNSNSSIKNGDTVAKNGNLAAMGNGYGLPSSSFGDMDGKYKNYCKANEKTGDGGDDGWMESSSLSDAHKSPKCFYDHVTFWSHSKTRLTTRITHHDAMEQASKILANMAESIITDAVLKKFEDDKIEVRTSQRLKKDSNGIYTIDYFVESDFEYLFNDNKSQASKVFRFFDNTRDNKVYFEEISQSLIEFFNEIVNTRNTFESFKDILNSLQTATNTFTMFILLFIYLIVFEFSFSDAVSLYVSFLAIGVFFGKDVMSRLIGGVTLIFSIQAFHVGDAILIDGKRFNVKKMDILTTWMTDTWGKLYIFHNSYLLKQLDGSFVNITQTNTPKHNLMFYIKEDVDQEQMMQFLDDFKKYITKHLRAVCDPDVLMVVGNFDRLFMRCKVQLWITSFVNFKEGKKRWNTQTSLYFEIKRILKRLGIQMIHPSNVNETDNALIVPEKIDGVHFH